MEACRHAPAREVCARAHLHHTCVRECRAAFDVILVTLLSASIIAQCLVMPGLCYAAQRHSAKWLIPYMTWRIALTLLVLGMAVYATTVYRLQSALPFDEWFTWLIVPPTVTEVCARVHTACVHTQYNHQVIMGTVCFGVCTLAYRHFKRRSISNIDEMY